MISVIIPVHNGDKYIKRCLDSVISQTYSELEIIVVDDGSTDETPKICNYYSVLDTRIRVITRENGGLSAARNTGLDHAMQGASDYIAFADCDDEMLPTMMEELLQTIEQSSADIAVCDFYQVLEGEVSSAFRGFHGDEERINDNKKALEAKRKPSAAESIRVYRYREKYKQLISNNLVTTVQWNKLYRKKIFEALRYPEGKYHEDEFVIHHELAAADQVAYLDKKLYLYYRHKDSITGTPTPEKTYHVLEAYKDRLSFFAQLDYGDLAGKTYNIYNAYINKYRTANSVSRDDKQWQSKIEDICDEIDALYADYFNKLPVGEKIKSKAFAVKYKLFLKKESIRVKGFFSR